MHIAARMAVTASAADQRRAERTAATVATTMRSLGYNGVDVVVRNISEFGFMAETREAFPAGSYVRLKLPCVGTVLARIAWVRDGAVGGEFLNAVSPVRLRMVPGVSVLERLEA